MANKNQKKVAKKQLLPKNSEADEPANHITDYAQLQNDELEALKAIYIDEFEEVEVKGAWSKSSDKAFRLHLKAPSDPEILVILSVRLTATYPKTAPILSVEKYNEVREASQRAITHVLENTVKELIGNVMIFEISSTIQDMLEVRDTSLICLFRS
jgi:translation initiation factor 2-alpha kinase 4